MVDEFDKSRGVVSEVEVRVIRPEERRRWDELMARHHSLGFRPFAGRGLRHVAVWRGHWLALVDWQARSSVPPGTVGWAGIVRCSFAGCTSLATTPGS